MRKHSTRTHTIRALVTLAVLATAVAALPVNGGAAAEKPQSTETGVSAKEIHIAAVDDVDNTIAPGILQGTVDGIRGAAKYINATGGLAGRKLVVDFYDSKLNPTEARNGFIKACENDYAMVATGTFLIASVDDIVNCKDKAGQTTGIPDLPAVTVGLLETCSPVSFPLNGSLVDCSTIKQSPQTYHTQSGDANYLQKKYGPLHGALIVSSDSKDTARSTSVLGLAAQERGVKIRATIPMSGRDPQTAYTPVIQQMKQNDDNYNNSGTPVEQVIAMRQEAQLQGLTDPKFIWTCLLQCYDKKMAAAGSAVDNTHVSMTFLPFEEAKYNKTLANFVKYVGKDKINGFAVWGWVAGLAFQQAVNSLVKTKGVNALTRANLLTAFKDLHAFNAGGMYGTVDIGGKLPSPCFLMLTVKGGKFTREYPSKPGTMDCTKSNQSVIEADVLNQ